MGDWFEKRTLGSLPENMARRFGEREAICFEGQRFTFAAVSAHADRVAKGLMASGIQPGDMVSLWLTNCPEWIFAMFALAKIGAIQVPINTRFRTDDLQYVMGQSDSTTLITHDVSGQVNYLDIVRKVLPLAEGDGGEISSEQFPKMKRVIIKSEREYPGTDSWGALLSAGDAVSDSALRERADAVDPDGTVFIMYTSGTTGFPKGVMHSHKIIRNVEDRANRMAITRNDVILNYLPLFHLFGYSEGAMMSMVTGARQVITATFDPDECVELIEKERVTIMNGFETHLKDLIDAQERSPHDMSSLRTGLFAAGMHSATDINRKAGTVLAPIKTFTGYGMSEMGVGPMLSSLDSSEEQRCETSGYPIQGYECRVIDPETGQEQPHEVPGELVIKGYSMMQGYYGKPKETADCYDAEGWFHTGDMAQTREDGYIRFLGRYKDMLKIGGENVDPMEVEGRLLEHPGVHQVAVVGFPDARLTEVAVAFVQPVPEAGIKPQEVIDYCKGRFASFKIPRHVLFVEEFPMTASGKIQKVKLRELAKQQIKPN